MRVRVAVRFCGGICYRDSAIIFYDGAIPIFLLCGRLVFLGVVGVFKKRGSGAWDGDDVCFVYCDGVWLVMWCVCLFGF